MPLETTDVKSFESGAYYLAKLTITKDQVSAYHHL